MKIRIKAGELTLEGEIFDTPCGRRIYELLPLEVSPRVWGDEFYFEIPLDWPLDETATDRVKVGDIGYWPPGKALAIFFGPTPMSTGPDPVPASAVNLVGRVEGAEALRLVKGKGKLRIEPADA